MNKKIPISEVYAKIPELIWDSQEQYEDAIHKYAEFRDAWVDAQVIYERDFSNAVQNLRNDKEKVTITRDLAQKDCIKQYELMNKLETQYKFYKTLIVGLENRINTLKFLGRIRFNMNEGERQ